MSAPADHGSLRRSVATVLSVGRNAPALIRRWISTARSPAAVDLVAGEPPPIDASAALRHGPVEVAVAVDADADLAVVARLTRPMLAQRQPALSDDLRLLKLTIRRPYGDDGPVVADLDGDALHGQTIPTIVRSLYGRLTLCVVEAEPEWTHLHAGTVSVAGRGMVIPAASGSGKSNLVAALARGHEVLTDELVAYDPETDLLRASNRPVCVKSPSHDRVARLAPHEPRPDGIDPWFLPARALGGAFQSVAVPWMIVFPVRGMGEMRLERVSPSETLETLIAHGFDITVVPERSLTDLATLSSVAPAWRLVYEEAVEAAEYLVAELAGLTARPNPVAWFAVPGGTRVGPEPCRHPASLGVVIGDGAVIWRPDTQVLIRLDGAGAAVWDHLDGRTPVPNQVADFVEQLVDHGLVDKSH